jgi:predicted transcriptional regulator
MLNGVSLRIHIAPAGYELDRITIPAQQMKADRVWLLAFNDREKDHAKSFRIEVEKILVSFGIETKVKECNIIDLYDVLRAIREIIEEEKNNDVFINVASGSKIEAIAGMLIASIFGELTSITPYYAVPVDYNVKPEITQPISVGLKSIEFLPEYHIEQPKPELIELLHLISKRGGKIKKKQLMEIAVENKLIKSNGEHKTQAYYASLNNNYLDKMKDWKLIEIESKGRSKEVQITKAGMDMLKFLGPIE